MTAPSPAGLSPLLDQLDEARAKGTPGPWTAEPNYRREDGCRCLSCWEPIPGSWDINPVDGPDCEMHDCFHAIRIGEADAALIVAAVNALPQLTAALRAVEALADEWENDDHPEGWNYSEYLRTALAALTPGADTAGATA